MPGDKSGRNGKATEAKTVDGLSHEEKAMTTEEMKETANVKAEYVTISPARAKRASLKDGGAAVTGYTVMIRPNGGTLVTIAEYLASDTGKALTPTTRRTLATYAKVTNRVRAIVAAHDCYQHCIAHGDGAIMAKTVDAEFADALAICQATDAANAAAREARKAENK